MPDTHTPRIERLRQHAEECGYDWPRDAWTLIGVLAGELDRAEAERHFAVAQRDAAMKRLFELAALTLPVPLVIPRPPDLPIQTV